MVVNARLYRESARSPAMFRWDHRSANDPDAKFKGLLGFNMRLWLGRSILGQSLML